MYPTTHVAVASQSGRSGSAIQTRTGEPYDPAEFDRVMASAVTDTVRKQVAIGIDVVSVERHPKIGYATYIKDRLTAWTATTLADRARLQDYRIFRARMAVFAGKRHSSASPASAPSSLWAARISTRISPICERLRPNAAPGAFDECGVTGVVSAFQPNRFYRRTPLTSKLSPRPCSPSTKRS